MVKMTTLYTINEKVKNVKTLHKWLKGLKCQHYALVANRLKMSRLYTSG